MKRLLLFIPFLITYSIFASCDYNDLNNPNIVSITRIHSTCSNNGSAIIIANGGGGEYFYEIVDGPITKILQSQNTFQGLYGGLYKLRVTGCNGKYVEDTFRINNEYSYMESFYSEKVDYYNSFKCGITNNAKAILYLSFVDTFFIRKPFCYQITTSNDPINGFNNLPCNSINFHSNPNSNGGFMTLNNSFYFSDTIYNLSPGNYFIRVIDSCDNFLTTSLVIPPPVSYNTSRIGYSINLANGKNGCVAIPYFRVKDTIANTFYTNMDNLPNAPYNLKIYNLMGNLLFNHNYKNSEHPSNGGGWSPNLGLNEFVPLNTPLIAQVTDKCGVTKTYNIPPYNSPNLSIISYGNSCENPNTISFMLKNYFSGVTVGKIYDVNNVLLGSVYINDVDYFDANIGIPKTIGAFSFFPVNIGSTYKVVILSSCNQADSITFVVPQPGLAQEPTFSSSFGYEYCISNPNKIVLRLTPIINTGISTVYLSNGPPASGPYPIYSGISNKYTFRNLVPGVYDVVVNYGCEQVMNFTVTVPNINGQNYTYNQDYVKQISCKGIGFDMVPQFTGYLPNLYCRIITMPPELYTHVKYLLTLDSIQAANQGYTQLIVGDNPSSFDTIVFMADTLELLNGNVNYTYNHIYRNPNNGSILYTNNASILPSLFLTDELNVDFRGRYIIDYYTCLSSQIIEKDTIDIEGRLPITLGSSVGLLCSNNSSTIIMSPKGGIRPYQYAYKNLSIPNSNFSTYTSDSVFNFTSIPVGTVFRFIIVDVCGTARTADISINNINASPVILSSDFCFNDTNIIFTQFIPYAQYTWTLNGNPVVFKDMYIKRIDRFLPSDTGVYAVNINYANGCINLNATKDIYGTNCLLPVELLDFSGSLFSNKSVLLKWSTLSEYKNSHFVLERSFDIINWVNVKTFNSKSVNGNSISQIYYNYFDDVSGVQKNVIYYRLKMVDFNEDYTYSNIIQVNINTNYKIDNSYFINDILYVDLLSFESTSVLINIYDLTCKLISSKQFSVNEGEQKINWDLSRYNLKAGVYFISLESDKLSDIFKIIISK